MRDTRFLRPDFDPVSAGDWVQDCALRSGWNDAEAARLASCVAESAEAVSSRAYVKSTRGPVFVKLDVLDDDAILELHHEGALGDRPCDCSAAQVALERQSSNWQDAQIRTHRLRIGRC